MRVDQEQPAHVNWTAILSYGGSLAVSLAVWFGVIRAVQYLVK